MTSAAGGRGRVLAVLGPFQHEPVGQGGAGHRLHIVGHGVLAAGEEGGKRKSAIAAPDEAGANELRYVMQASDGRHVLARRPVTVR